MENSNLTPQPQAPVIPSNHPKIVILRWGHRVQRDVRLTTHVALTARALCASGFILADTTDSTYRGNRHQNPPSMGRRLPLRNGHPLETGGPRLESAAAVSSYT